MSLNKKKVGEFARMLKKIEVILEQIIPIYAETGLPPEFAESMGGLEEAFLDVTFQLSKACKRGHYRGVIDHPLQVYNLEQVERWADEAP